jgi:hypothetical protein
MAEAQQSFKNHAKTIPIYHYFALPVSLINAIWLLVRLVRAPSVDTGIAAAMGVALAVMFLMARIFALTVQDRVIRVEMRMRLRELLPADLQPRIGEFTRNQLVSLRFASDAELPTLARRVLDERLDDRKAIKMLVKDWQADHLRA